MSAEFKSLEAIQAALEKAVLEGYEEENLPRLGLVYQHLGLLPESANLKKTLIEFSRFQRIVHYDARRRSVTLPQESLKAPFPFLLPPGERAYENAMKILSTYALTDALQKQHFYADEMIRTSRPRDGRLALQALLRGDQVLVGLASMIGDDKDKAKKLLAEVRGMALQSARVDTELSSLPELFRQKMIFQYLNGSQFVLWAYSLKGWDGVNMLYTRPPLSTAQILNPEKYYVRREDPIRVIPWSLIRLIEGKPIVEETLGAFLIRLLLSSSFSNEDAARISAAWRGDTLLAFQQGDKVISGWVTAWENSAKAKEFRRGYEKVLEKRLGAPLGTVASRGDTLFADPSGGSPLLLQAKDNFVLYLEGVSPPQSFELAEEVWRDLEVVTEPSQIPYDLVHRFIHSRSTAK